MIMGNPSRTDDHEFRGNPGFSGAACASSGKSAFDGRDSIAELFGPA